MRRGEHLAAMGSLVAAVAHDARNALFGISATVEALATRLGENHRAGEHLSALRGQVDRLNHLMADLLECGRPIAREVAPDSLEAVVEEASRGCAAQAGARRVAIDIPTSGGLPTVAMDRERLVRAFENLIHNAIQHSPADGRVKVEWGACAGDAVRVAVRDGGAGIHPRDLPHVFEPFFSRRVGGTGLGLSIVEQIVDGHGGKVAARNHPEGGAEVVVTLPAAGPSKA